MSNKFVTEGTHFNFTAGSAVASGAVVLMADTIGIANTAVASGDKGTACTEGVHTLAKLSTDNIAQGAKVYWDATNSRITLSSAGNTLAGRAYAAAGAGVSTVQVKINF